jgi:hypothetical protein
MGDSPVKTSTALLALAVALAAPAASRAQFFKPFTSRKPPTAEQVGTSRAPAAAAPAATGATAPGDPNLQKSGFVVPPPINGDDQPPPNVKLPPEPIEPFLLTQENGPFMVIAHTFKGPCADKYAQMLAMELRSQFGLPAYVLRPKDFPLRSLVRGTPPTANPGINRTLPGLPELARIKDEAMVLVGDEKTMADAKKLLHQVKKLHPTCLNIIPETLPWRKGRGLFHAMVTTNPYVPAEKLFPHQPDLMIHKINQGPHSIYTCPGKFSMQVAEFTGRKQMVTGNQPPPISIKMMQSSPLATAADDAERLAEALARDKDVRKTGYVPYVYHDRYSSKVYMGAFNAPDDPAVKRLHDDLLKMAVDLNIRKVTDVVIVPSGGVTDVAEIRKR